MGGGKSRKTGSISKALIDKIQKGNKTTGKSKSAPKGGTRKGGFNFNE